MGSWGSFKGYYKGSFKGSIGFRAPLKGIITVPNMRMEINPLQSYSGSEVL